MSRLPKIGKNEPAALTIGKSPLVNTATTESEGRGKKNQPMVATILNDEQRAIRSRALGQGAGSRNLKGKTGSMIFAEATRAHAAVRKKKRKIAPAVLDPMANGAMKDGLTLEKLITRPYEEVIAAIRTHPVFWQTMLTEKEMIPMQVTAILAKMRSTDIADFAKHLALETSLHGTLRHCKTIEDMEHAIMNNLPIRNVIIWVKGETADFLISPSTRETVPLRSSIVGYCLERHRKVVTTDPANHPGFHIDYDLTLLRGASSMAMFPILTDFGDPICVLQCIDYFDIVANVALPFPPYALNILKLVRNCVKQALYSDLDHLDAFVPDEVGTVLSNYRATPTLEEAACRVSKLLEKLMGCDCVDIYEFDEKKRRMRDLRTNTPYKDLASGGVAFQAAMSGKPVFVAHGMCGKHDSPEIDRRFTNRCVLAKRFPHRVSHYVFALRSRWQSPSFYPEDLRRLKEIVGLVCDSLNGAKIFESKTLDVTKIGRLSLISNVICETLENFAVQGADPWALVVDVARQFFRCETCHVCVFEGLVMRFLPSEVTCKFDECIGGRAYNYHEVTEYRATDGEESSEPYKSMNIACKYAVAAPLPIDGKIKGAVEIVNPECEVDVEARNALLSLCASILKI